MRGAPQQVARHTAHGPKSFMCVHTPSNILRLLSLSRNCGRGTLYGPSKEVLFGGDFAASIRQWCHEGATTQPYSSYP
jgi:hypothetical protein